MELSIKKLTNTAKIPNKAHIRDLGYDIFADEDVTFYPRDYKIVKTGISILCPNGKWGFIIKDRSSIACKGLFTHAGVIDCGYTGEVKVLFYNGSNNIIEIEQGDKIAQLIPTQVVSFEINEIDKFHKTIRGDKGFGSTGK